MRPKNARLVVLVAAVAVAAVAIGGVLAYSQGPQTGGEAAPLSASTPTTGPGKTTSPSSATPPTTPATTAYTGATKVTLKLSKLPKGRVPQVPYMIDREVLGGAGPALKLPGSQVVLEFARLGEEALAVVEKEDASSSELLRVSYLGVVERVPDVTNVVSTDDQLAAAYATQPRTKDGANAKGGIVYARTAGNSQVHKLSLPKLWEPRVLAYAEGKVFFRAGAEEQAGTWSLYSWTPGAAEATQIKTIDSPTALTRDAKIAGSRNVAGDYGTCSTVNEVATGKRLWRTCEYSIDGFTPDGTVAIGGPHYADGYSALESSALDAKTGNLLREWSGASMIETFVEDDQHFLIIADDGPDTPRGIIRCTLPTGTCEQAVPLTTKRVELGQ